MSQAPGELLSVAKPGGWLVGWLAALGQKFTGFDIVCVALECVCMPPFAQDEQNPIYSPKRQKRVLNTR